MPSAPWVEQGLFPNLEMMTVGEYLTRGVTVRGSCSIPLQPLLIDPGTFAYVDSDAERNRFRGTAGHNTAQVDDLNQVEPSGPFGWEGLPNVRVDRWVTGKTFDLFVGSHRGYCRLRRPVQHRRYVFYSKPNFWLIRDVLQGDGVHR